MRRLLILLAILGTLTAGLASIYGWGLPSQLDEPVSIREESVSGRRAGLAGYFIAGGRSHRGGSFQGGK